RSGLRPGLLLRSLQNHQGLTATAARAPSILSTSSRRPINRIVTAWPYDCERGRTEWARGWSSDNARPAPCWQLSINAGAPSVPRGKRFYAVTPEFTTGGALPRFHLRGRLRHRGIALFG